MRGRVRRACSGLLARFLLIVFISVGINAGVDIYAGLSKRAAVPAELSAEAIAKTKIAASSLERTFDGARQLLRALANIPSIQNHDAATCVALGSVGLGMPMYDYISLRRLDGTLECGTVESPRNVQADPWLHDVTVSSRDFVIGFYGRSKINEKDVVRLSYPVVSSDGAVIGTVSAGLNLDWLDATLAAWNLPEGVALDIADMHGVLLARRPGMQSIGHPLPEGLKAALDTPDDGTIAARGLDGTARVYGHAIVRLGSVGAVLVAVGLDRDATITAVEEATWHDLSNSLIVLVVAMLMSWVVMRRTVGRPIRDLLATAQRWQAGDWTARPQLHSRVREFDALASGFNAMADAVATREAELRHSKDHLTRAQRVAETGSFEVDFLTGRAIWSDETYRVFGLSPDSGQPAPDAVIAMAVPEDQEALRQAHDEAKAGRESSLREYRIRRPDGAIRVIYREVEPVRDEMGAVLGAIGVVKDVTDLREIERQRDEFERQLLHAQKIEAIGTLAGGIAHDLNNALLPVIALSVLAMKRIPPKDRTYQNLKMIHEAGLRSRDLVRRILDFARKSEPARRRVDLQALTASTLTLLRSTLPSTITIRDRLEPVPAIWADEGQVHQILMNLCTNAAQAIGDHMGTISVELTLRAGKPSAGDTTVRLSVTDSGCGMDAATRERIFEPFFTTKRVGEGTGLGLSVVHGIVTAHRGTISVESAPGKGTRFDVEFPAASDEDEHEEKAA